MRDYTAKEYIRFFCEQFRQKSNGEYFCVMIYPLRGEAYAIKKHPDEMQPNELAYVYELNKKELNFFRNHKEYCNVWILLKGANDGN